MPLLMAAILRTIDMFLVYDVRLGSNESACSQNAVHHHARALLVPALAMAASPSDTIIHELIPELTSVQRR
jgi:hypothetical protein